ncbi:MAG TPA: ATP-binding cassette domain-containing protein [Candidatus Peribacteraceae bacterium]|nr:ATP-binding cassette domain-containing protein [Candidatus Peribacteraceae bacterium]
MIALKNVTKRFGKQTVLENLSLRIDPGNMLCVIGASGSGKTTLLHLLIRATDPTDGTVEVDGVNIRTLPTQILQLYRRRVGVIYQEPLLIESLTVEENVALPLELLGAPEALIKRNTADLLKRLGLSGKAQMLPEHLSLSERALVGIARAIVTSPMVIAADEPFRDLDDKQIETVCEFFRNMQKKGATIVVFSHDASTARALGAQSVQLKDGKISKQEVAKAPAKKADTHRILEESDTPEDDLPPPAGPMDDSSARPLHVRSMPRVRSGKSVRITSIGSGS